MFRLESLKVYVKILKSLLKSFGTSRSELSMKCISVHARKSNVPSADWLMNDNNKHYHFPLVLISFSRVIPSYFWAMLVGCDSSTPFMR